MKFKMLMKDGKFVNASAIGEVIVESQVPYLFSKDTTIEAMVGATEKFGEQVGIGKAKRIIENLKQCEMVECEIKRTENPDSANTLNLFRGLDDEDIIQFKAWARENYVAGSAIEPVWHPTIQKECKLINEENGISN